MRLSDKEVRTRKIKRTFFALVQEFKSSAKFQGLKPNSQLVWGRELDYAARPGALGDLPLWEIRPALISEYLDGWDDKPSKQAAALSAFKALEKWAIVRDKLQRPITLGVETGKPTGGHMPWTDEQVAIGETHARRDIAQAITLGANTGQRCSDLVRMGWGDIETFQGRAGINVKQVKTGREIWCPILEPLRQAMDTWERQPGPFLRRIDGRAWTPKGLSDVWIYHRDHYEELRPLRDAGLVLHGLRGHACVRLYRAGCTTRMVADLVGMSEKMVANYTRKSDQRANAMAAVTQLEGANLRKLKTT